MLLKIFAVMTLLIFQGDLESRGTVKVRIAVVETEVRLKWGYSSRVRSLFCINKLCGVGNDL